MQVVNHAVLLVGYGVNEATGETVWITRQQRTALGRIAKRMASFT